MNKQRSMWLELSLLAGIIIAAGIIIWNTDFGTGTSSTVPQLGGDNSSTSEKQSGKDQKPNANTTWAEGKTLFKSNCASCHNPRVAVTGPALMGVTKRWEEAGNYKTKTGKQWLYTWIKNWNEPVNAGYPYAVKIANYSPSVMNTFPSMKDEEIDKILLYVENPDQGNHATTVVASY